MQPITLYGGPFSLWTGRARSYLIKSGIAYREEPHASQHFFDTVLPKAGGRRGIPTIEFPNGDVIRDGVAIVDHFEALNGEAFSPRTPRQQIASLLLDAVGGRHVQIQKLQPTGRNRTSTRSGIEGTQMLTQ